MSWTDSFRNYLKKDVESKLEQPTLFDIGNKGKMTQAKDAVVNTFNTVKDKIKNIGK